MIDGGEGAEPPVEPSKRRAAPPLSPARQTLCVRITFKGI